MPSHPSKPKQTLKSSDFEHIAGTPTVHHESPSKKRRKDNRVGDLNLTSMLDVCFQLLIFFVLTASFAVGEGVLPAELPVGQGAKSDDTEPPTTPITIMLRSTGPDAPTVIEIQGRPNSFTDFGELYGVLYSLQRRADNPAGIYTDEDPVVIQPNGDVPWGSVVDAFNQAVRARFLNVNFAQPQAP